MLLTLINWAAIKISAAMQLMVLKNNKIILHTLYTYFTTPLLLLAKQKLIWCEI